eukprot:1859440-Prymnesium_polylepis.1
MGVEREPRLRCVLRRWRAHLAREEEHGRARAYGGHVVRLQVVDDVRDGVDALARRDRWAIIVAINH